MIMGSRIISLLVIVAGLINGNQEYVRRSWLDALSYPPSLPLSLSLSLPYSSAYDSNATMLECKYKYAYASCD